MSLSSAAASCRELRAALEAEVENARGERRLLRTLDAPSLQARAAARADFLATSARLEREIAEHLVRGAEALGLQEVTLQRLRLADPVHGREVAELVSDVRALAEALSELDRLNLALARRAQAFVSGYVDALAPAPAAYDRRGVRARAGAPALALVSRKG